MQSNHFTGIDVSKLTLDFHLLDRNNNTICYDQIANEPKAINKLLLAYKKNYGVVIEKTVFCLEFTGIYTGYLLSALSKQKALIWMETGVQIKKSMGMTRGKNDKIDSLRIAQYALRYHDKIRLWEAPREILAELTDLEAYRRQLVDQRKALKTTNTERKAFKKATYIKFISNSSEDLIAGYDKKIEEVESLLMDLVHGDEKLNRLYEIITSVEGVGFVTAINIIIATNEFKGISEPKKFACYSGVAPFNHQSGTSVRGKMRVSPMADKRIKSLLCMCALNAMKSKGELKAYAERKLVEGKNKMLIVNNLKNKLIHRIFACVKADKLYEKNYQHSLA